MIRRIPGIELITDCETCKSQIEMSTSKKLGIQSVCWRGRWIQGGKVGLMSRIGMLFDY
ncbi:hypothetical protein XNC1_0648 [Xenorhabdus nematophila ATCC 19061]|uniref:Uncharacterized protein n=1 Tax=Xenorhabdus nematophila (strain ATCC 19061 / DSM 3370 / CCUG 14189 / LMG 1036 / NCIMB 9965 / AN6) TaxID=406817 RepID=D3VJG3_XENNA|nr:hypothetical protein XNC1_0648 [Xenorhabdus nematophila ATCC 19061]